MLLIRDVVQENQRAAEVGDVQLAWYPNHPYNADLAKGYMFTATAEAGKKSSLDILTTIRDTFIYTNENRLTVIATYGHGKTHLALALANFFGKPSDSPEVGDLLAGIEHVAPKLVGGLRSFKEDNPPLLVVRLQGNDSENLPRLVFRAVERALHEVREYIGEVSLPFWFASAARFLDQLTPDQTARANTFLAPHRQDVAALLAAVRDKDNAMYDRCRDVSEHILGVPADFGGNISLDEVIAWLTENYCGRDKALRGLLVLFDEFAVFVEKYAERLHASNAGALQQLLDGIANARSSACFVAFSQQDPGAVADQFFARNPETTGKEKDLTKELTRLPRDKRFLLHSSLERVLDSHLNENLDVLAEVEVETGDAFLDATDLVLQMLPQRYDALHNQEWGTEEVYRVVTHGCFPLHPLTTGLLCTLQLQQGTVTRSVLGSVRQAMDVLRNQAAVLDGTRPNWIHPIALVDWFEDMLADEALFGQFQSARQNVGSDAAPAEKDTLKAIFLQIVANLAPLSHADGGYAHLVASLTGRSEAGCRAALKALADRYLIEKDPVKEFYRFPQGGDGERTRKLAREVERLGRETKLTFLTLNDHLRKSERLRRRQADGLPSGNAHDYAAQEWLLTRITLTPANLQSLIAPLFQIATNERGVKSLRHGARGALVFLVAQNDDDVAFYDEHSQRILDEAFPPDRIPVPLVMGIPAAPHRGLLSLVKREVALGTMEHQLREFGPNAAGRVRDTLKAELDAVVKELRGEMRWIVPSAFSAAVNQNAAKNDAGVKLQSCYAMAYADMPPAFKAQYPASNAQLRRAVDAIASPLANGSLKGSMDVIRNGNPIAKDILTNYLTATTNSASWGLIDHLGTIQLPTRPRLRKVWDHLDRCFAPGIEPSLVRNALIPLLNPPFGYDWNHATLVFCAWLGYHAGRIVFEENGKQQQLQRYLELITRPEDFVTQLCERDVALRQLDQESETQRVRALVDHLRQNRIGQTEARNYVSELSKFAQNAAMDAEAREQARQTVERITQGLRKVEEYEDEAQRILRFLTTSAGLEEVQLELGRIEQDQLPKLGLVSTDRVPTADALRQRVREHIAVLVQREARRYGALPKLEQYEEFRAGLARARQHAVLIRESALQYDIDSKLEALERRKRELESEHQDRLLIAELANIHADSLPMVRLTELEQDLATKHAAGERAAERLEQRLADIRKYLSEARAFLPAQAAALEAATSHTALSAIQRKMDRNKDRFVGSHDEATFDDIEARLSGLLDAFSILDRTPARTISSPREWDARNLDLRTAMVDFGDILGEAHRLAFDAALVALEEKRRAEEKKATEWIEKYEAKPPRDVTALDDPPAFLTADGKKRLKALKAQLQDEIQKRIDKDEMEAIRSRFQKLSPAKRRECLLMLQEMLESLGANLA